MSPGDTTAESGPEVPREALNRVTTAGARPPAGEGPPAGAGPEVATAKIGTAPEAGHIRAVAEHRARREGSGNALAAGRPRVDEHCTERKRGSSTGADPETGVERIPHVLEISSVIRKFGQEPMLNSS